MRAIVIVLGLVLLASTVPNHKNLIDSNDANLARVRKIEGLYVFVDSEPFNDYESLGLVKVGFAFTSGQYTSVRNLLLNKVRKKHPSANGAILFFVDGGIDKAEAILIKDK